jgi:iron(III) transport system permease protein
LLAWTAITGSGAAGQLTHLLSTVLPRYVLNSVALVLVVTAMVLLIGVGCAWLIAAYDFPGRRFFRWALVLPLALPSFVVAYAYNDFNWLASVSRWAKAHLGVTIPRIGDWGNVIAAGVVLALVLYPYVYLLARTAFEERSPSLGEAALSLGIRRASAWWRVVWPIARPSIAAGCALVIMETLADFGTVAYFAVDTFTAGIYRSWQSMGDKTTAARLALLLMGFVLILTSLERSQRARMRYFARGRSDAPRLRLQWPQAALALLACLTPLVFGLLLPLLLLTLSWLDAGAQLSARLFGWALNSAMLAALATVLIIPATLLAAYGLRLMPGPRARWLTTLACSGYALPGLVLAIGLLSFVGMVDRLIGFSLLSGTLVAVVYAYSVRFFSIGYQSIESGLTRINPSMEQSASSLGLNSAETLRKVHWPLLRSSVAIASLLVFVDCLKELPATLVLRPFNFDTLSVVAYHFASDERLGEAAAPALLIALVSLLPVLVLSVYRPARR